MNIFVLSTDPVEAAVMQLDRHIVKMPLESAQMLCAAYPDGEAPYKKTHYNHPSTVWARQSRETYMWLYYHMIGLGNEYEKRYNKQHLTITKCGKFLATPPKYIQGNEWVQPPQAMPDEYKHKDSIIANKQ